MGELRRPDGSNPVRLLSHHLIGRGPECALRLDRSYVSSQHALIRWQGHVWELLDRGSRNGTRLDGASLEPGRPYAMRKGSTMTFGQADEIWVLAEASGPEVLVVGLDSGEVIRGAQGLIGLPTSENPECTLYRDIDDHWKIETSDGSVRLLSDAETFEVAGQRFRFSLPSAIESTASLGGSTPGEKAALRFSVSSDEEFVTLELVYANRSISLGSRAHNYLLLTLARSYLADVEAGVDPPSCGWVDKGDLAAGLRLSPEQVDGEVFRIRKHFARFGLKEAAVVIERRPRTKQIRIGIKTVRIERS